MPQMNWPFVGWNIYSFSYVLQINTFHTHTKKKLQKNLKNTKWAAKIWVVFFPSEILNTGLNHTYPSQIRTCKRNPWRTIRDFCLWEIFELIPHAVKKKIDLGYFPYAMKIIIKKKKDKKNRSRLWSVFGTEINVLNGTYHQATKLSEAINENQIRTKLYWQNSIRLWNDNMTISAPKRIHRGAHTHTQKLSVHLGDSRTSADRFLHAFGQNEERNKKQGKQNKNQTSNSLGE